MPKDQHSEDVSISGQIAACQALCAQALATDYCGFADRIDGVPSTPAACFALLLRIPHDATAIAALQRLEQDAQAAGLTTNHWLARYVVLQACQQSLPLLAALRVDDSVKAQFCLMCRYLAGRQQPQDTRLEVAGDAFAELAKILTHRRFHAGQLSYDVMDLPRAWLLKLHPMELPGVVRELREGFGGLGPVVMPHINYWRPNPLFVTLKEQERSLRRIAKSIAPDSRIRGFISSSWVYAEAVGEATPHLAWLRDFFAANNAYIADAGPALKDAGFLVGSDKRRQLHTEGRFQPRETLVLWRRADMMTWAGSVAGSGAESSGAKPAVSRARPRARGQDNPPGRVRSGHLTLFDCRRLLYYKPRHYIAAVLVAPTVIAAVAAAALWPAAVLLPVVICALLLMWLVQYFLLQ